MEGYGSMTREQARNLMDADDYEAFVKGQQASWEEDRD